MKRKNILLPVVGAAFLLAGCTDEDIVTDVTHYKNELIEEEASDDEAIMSVSNGQVSLSIDQRTTGFVFTDENGQKWPSIPEYVEQASGANIDSVKSSLILEYSSEAGVTQTYGTYPMSVAKDNFNVVKVENGDEIGFDVNYTIGNISKEYIIPVAMNQADYDAFSETMDSKAFKKYVRQYYEKKDINKLLATDNKDELLEKYPDLANEPLYILMDNTPDHLKQTLEDSFAESGFTKDDYLANLDKYGKRESGVIAKFNVTLELRLDGNQLVASVPFDKIEYVSAYVPIHIDILPYFAAGSVKDEGYMLVPDGSGAVINFNNGKSNQSPFNNKLYGWDDAKLRKSVIDDSVSTYASYVISTKDKGSVLCCMEDGKSYGSIEADVSGRLGDFNFAFASYDLIHYADMDVSSKTDKTVRVFEDDFAEGEQVSQRYIFTEKENYADVAAIYRDYLIENEGLTKKEDTVTPLVIEAVGAVDTIDQIGGVPSTVALPLTTYNQTADIIKDLSGEGIDFKLRYSGWFNGGVENKNAHKVSTISNLGSKNDLKNVLSTAESNDVDIFLGGTFNYVYRDKFYDSYSLKKDSAKYVGREICEKYPISSVWFGEEDEELDPYYVTKPSYAMESLDKYMNGIEKLGGKNVAFEDLGYRVNSDFNPKDLVTREQSMKMQQDKFAELTNDGSKLMMKGGNDFALKYSDVVTDFWIDSKMYNIEDQEVPFYAIAVHGLVDYTGSSINLSDDYSSMFLKSVETGAGLYYSVIEQNIAKLTDTEYTEYYGADYSKWRDQIVEDYTRVNDDMGHVYNQYITDYQVPDVNVTMTEYEDGTKVYVNYNYSDCTVDGITIPARDYLVVGGDK